MSFNTIIAILAAIVVVGGGTYFITHRDAGSSQASSSAVSGQTGQGSPAAATTGTGTQTATSGTFGSLLAQKGSQKCTFSGVQQGAHMDGTIYLSDGHFRYDITVALPQLAGKTMDSHMLQKDDSAYVWGSMMGGRGIKIPAIVPSAAGKTGSKQSIDTSASVQYSCSPWTYDATLFTLPAGITFTANGR